VTLGSREAVYRIRTPPSMTLLSRIMRAWRMVFAARSI